MAKFKIGDIIKHQIMEEYLIVARYYTLHGQADGGYSLVPLCGAGIDSFDFNSEWVDDAYILVA